MKELTIEEKAKAYDEAIDKIKYVMEHGVSPTLNKEDLQDIFPELKESEDEGIRKALISHFCGIRDNCGKDWYGFNINDIIVWLEKQGQHANFLSKIQICDKVTRNEDGVLVNLSQLNRVAKKPAEWHREDEQNLNACLGYIPDEFLRRWLTDIIHVKYDKPAWSEEDEKIYQSIMDDTVQENQLDDKQILWLKSIKDRVQPKQE